MEGVSIEFFLPDSRYESHCPLVADRMWEANVKAKHTRRNPLPLPARPLSPPRPSPPSPLDSPPPHLIRFCLHSDFRRRSFLTCVFRSLLLRSFSSPPPPLLSPASPPPIFARPKARQNPQKIILNQGPKGLRCYVPAGPSSSSSPSFSQRIHKNRARYVRSLPLSLSLSRDLSLSRANIVDAN